jgi:RHS repeat-associated protein
LARSYFGARYDAGTSGRFITVDPEHVAGDILDPQSWNGYAYARNNPFQYSDPDGREYEICVEGAPTCQRVSD